MTRHEARCAGLKPLTSPYTASEIVALEREYQRLLATGAAPQLIARGAGTEIWCRPVRVRRRGLARADYHMLRKG